MRWAVETHSAVDAEIAALPTGLRAKLLRLLRVVEEVGLERMHEPHAKHLEGKLWELRVSAAEGIARGLYVTMNGRKVMVLHVFEKKTQKTPRRAIELAFERMTRME
ncbi:type II toxin-antitoxin system RelE/ParE family toxin [Tabrizicola sp.]|uniref:type II toxin-antitoxin system RelE/ParE family toxin n=1 Tax=Tabrizicola sp. TaxID=2005166 RepID=UPI0035B47AE5